MKRTLILPLLSLLLFLSCSKDKASDPNPPGGGGAGQKDIAAIDDRVKSLMSTYQIPGVSIAITKNEKLIYVKSYGQVGKSDNAPVTNKSLFRIASVSKSVTAIGVLKLLEANKLTLDQKVLGPSGILSEYTAAQMDKMDDITVKQLLSHTTGLWPNDGNDPMFKNNSMNHHDLIQWTLNNVPVTKASRGTYQYSNFGYCLLGRVIEKISGKSYEQFIKEQVLTPAGISDMVICGNSLAERKPDEVIYEGQGWDPYAINASRMDSHGGWIASATDLVKLMARVDGSNGTPDILKPATVTIMKTEVKPGSYYGLGWAVGNGNMWHTGAISGTAAEVIHSSTGYSWAVLCNSRSYNSGFDGALDNLLWPIIQNTSTPWQDIDQFK